MHITLKITNNLDYYFNKLNSLLFCFILRPSIQACNTLFIQIVKEYLITTPEGLNIHIPGQVKGLFRCGRFPVQYRTKISCHSLLMFLIPLLRIPKYCNHAIQVRVLLAGLKDPGECRSRLKTGWLKKLLKNFPFLFIVIKG